MSNIAYPYSFSANTTIISAQVNSNFAAVSSVVNGNLDNTNFTTLTGALNWAVTSNVSAITASSSGTAALATFNATGIWTAGVSGISITSNAAQSTGQAGLYVSFTSASSTIPAALLNNAGTGPTMSVTQSGLLAASQAAALISVSGVQTTGLAACEVDITNASSTVPVFASKNAGSGNFVKYSDNSGNQKYGVDSAGAHYPATLSALGLSNLSITASVASNALTVALKQKDAATDPTAALPAAVGFRSSTAGSGTFNTRQVTSALSIVVPASTTIGTLSGAAHYIYVYALDNAGTVELAVSLTAFDEGSLQSSTSVSGGSSNSTLYSTTGRSNVPVRLLARLSCTEATAGTWATAPSEISNVPLRSFPSSQTFGPATTSDANLGTITSTQLSQFYRGSFTLTFNAAYNANQTPTFTYQIVGKLVTIYCPTLKALGFSSPGADNVSTAGMPSVLQPPATLTFPCIVHDNGADVATPGCLQITSSGVFHFGKSALFTTNYTASQNLGWEGFCVSYLIS